MSIFKYYFHVISVICATYHKGHIRDELLQKHVVLF